MCVEEDGQKLETYEVSKDWEIEILFHPNDSAFSSAKEKNQHFIELISSFHLNEWALQSIF